MHEFLLDRRQVHASIALVTAGMSAPSLRALALRWADRLTEILARHVSRDAAVAVGAYLDGATIHAGLHDTPIDEESIARTIRVLLEVPSSTEHG